MWLSASFHLSRHLHVGYLVSCPQWGAHRSHVCEFQAKGSGLLLLSLSPALWTWRDSGSPGGCRGSGYKMLRSLYHHLEESFPSTVPPALGRHIPTQDLPLHQSTELGGYLCHLQTLHRKTVPRQGVSLVAAAPSPASPALTETHSWRWCMGFISGSCDSACLCVQLRGAVLPSLKDPRRVVVFQFVPIFYCC